MTFIAKLLLIVVSPVLLMLYFMALVGSAAFFWFNTIYQPLHELAGKPFDRKDE